MTTLVLLAASTWTWLVPADLWHQHRGSCRRIFGSCDGVHDQHPITLASKQHVIDGRHFVDWSCAVVVRFHRDGWIWVDHSRREVFPTVPEGSGRAAAVRMISTALPTTAAAGRASSSIWRRGAKAAGGSAFQAPIRCRYVAITPSSSGRFSQRKYGRNRSQASGPSRSDSKSWKLETRAPEIPAPTLFVAVAESPKRAVCRARFVAVQAALAVTKNIGRCVGSGVAVSDAERPVVEEAGGPFVQAALRSRLPLAVLGKAKSAAQPLMNCCVQPGGTPSESSSAPTCGAMP